MTSDPAGQTLRQPQDKPFLVYADGSCLGNPGPGGWGVVITDPGGKRHEYGGGDRRTTNNRMELTAAIEGLRRVPAGARVVLRSDSQYLVNSVNLMWRRKANLDLWKELDAEITRRKVKFEWVRGHAEDELNERADYLAQEQARTAASSSAQSSSEPSASQEQNRVPMPVPAGHADPNPPKAPAASVSAPQTPPEETALTDAIKPLLAANESVRRCASCGELFIAPDRYPHPYCALARCQLERRRKRQPV